MLVAMMAGWIRWTTERKSLQSTPTKNNVSKNSITFSHTRTASEEKILTVQANFCKIIRLEYSIYAPFIMHVRSVIIFYGEGKWIDVIL